MKRNAASFRAMRQFDKNEFVKGLLRASLIKPWGRIGGEIPGVYEATGRRYRLTQRGWRMKYYLENTLQLHLEQSTALQVFTILAEFEVGTLSRRPKEQALRSTLAQRRPELIDGAAERNACRRWQADCAAVDIANRLKDI
jgi:hypothetical protein